MNRYLFCVATLLLLAFANTTFAQDITARIDGQVTDPAGAVVTKATVTLTNTRTGEVRTVEADDNGSYTLTGIQPGTYDLSVKAPGIQGIPEQGFGTKRQRS